MFERRKHISVLFVPDDDGSDVTRFRLSSFSLKFLKALPFILVFLIFTTGILSWRFIQIKSDKAKLERRNAKLKKENKKIAALADTLRQIKAIDRQLRFMASGREFSEDLEYYLSGYKLGETLGPFDLFAYNQGEEVSFIWPVKGKIVVEFGENKALIGGGEKGIEILVSKGLPVRASADGKVDFSGQTDNFGKLVILNHENGFSTKYGYNSKLFVKKGDEVKKGQIIALTGKSGHTSSPRLRYEIWKGGEPVDPEKYLSERSTYGQR